MRVFAAMLLKVANQLIIPSVVGQPLHRRHIEHVRQAGIPDRQNLFPDGVSH